MGLYDGRSGATEEGSTAEMAKRLRLPVILVVDASAMARSVAAMIQGYRQFDRKTHVAGVVFNRVAGMRHRALLENAVARHVPGLPCLGAVDDLGRLLVHQHSKEVIALHPAAGGAWLEPVIRDCQYFQVLLRIVPEALLTSFTDGERELTDVFHRALSTGGFVGGPLSDRFGAPRVMVATLVASVPFLAVAPVLPPWGFTAMLAVGAGLCRHVLCFRTVWEASAQGDKGRASVTDRIELSAPIGDETKLTTC